MVDEEQRRLHTAVLVDNHKAHRTLRKICPRRLRYQGCKQGSKYY